MTRSHEEANREFANEEERRAYFDRTGAPFIVGDTVVKGGGDYFFRGEVRCCFQKRSGVWRVVVENYDGIVHIFNPNQLARE